MANAQWAHLDFLFLKRMFSLSQISSIPITHLFLLCACVVLQVDGTGGLYLCCRRWWRADAKREKKTMKKTCTRKTCTRRTCTRKEPTSDFSTPLKTLPHGPFNIFSSLYYGQQLQGFLFSVPSRDVSPQTHRQTHNILHNIKAHNILFVFFPKQNCQISVKNMTIIRYVCCLMD